MRRKLLHGLLIGLTASIFFSVLFILGLFESWQYTASDKIFPTRGVRPDVVIIGIDNASINEIGRWPWSREIFAEILDKLEDGNPYAIGIDVAFLEEQNEVADGKLATKLADLKNVVLAAESEKGDVILPIPAFAQHAKVGIVNLNPDPDGIVRQAPIRVTADDGKVYNHFAIEVLKTHLEQKGVSDRVLNDLPDESGFVRINYAAPPGTFTTYSFADVLSGKVVPANFKDKIILIGATAPDLHDNQITPLSSGVHMNGVEIHANIIQMVLEGKFLYVEQPMTTVLTALLVGIVLALILIFSKIWVAIIIAAVTLGAYVIYAIFSFDAGVIRHIIVPPLVIVSTAIGNVIYKYYVEFRQKKYLRKAFSYYLSNAVLSEILSHPDKLKLGGARQDMSVLFSDIAGFTTISEKLDPEDLAHMLNGYLTRMTDIVFHNVGVLDKYIGDAVMAFWGAPLKEPDHAYLACKTALEMQSEMDQVRLDWKEYDVPHVDIRIGVNSGEMVVGNMGSDSRFDYTLIGDNVNLGSRLEGINKEYGTKIVISQTTFDGVRGRVIARRLDTVAVKGKETGVTIYELRDLGQPEGQEATFLRQFEEARKLYEKGEFKKALESFDALSKTYPEDSPIKVYIERLKILNKQKPEKWDGIFKATSK